MGVKTWTAWTTRQWLDLFRKPHTLKGAAEAMGVSVWGVKVAKGRLRRAGFRVPRAIGARACAGAVS
jgi:hypothetical protein